MFLAFIASFGRDSSRSQFRFVASQQFRHLCQPAVDVLHHRIVEVRPLNPCQCPGGLPLFRFGVAYRNMELAGPPQFGEEAQEFGRQILRNLGHTPPERPIMPECSELHDPLEADRALREGLPPWQTHFMSDDYVEYTWHAPTVRLFIGRCMVERPDDAPEHVLPMWVWNAMGGKRECIDPTIFSAARTIGYTVLDLMACPDELARAKAEFAERMHVSVQRRVLRM